MHQAARADCLLVAQEQKLDGLFASGKADEKSVSTTVREIARLQGEIRWVHLRAHIKMKQLFTREQVEKHDELRGFNRN